MQSLSCVSLQILIETFNLQKTCILYPQCMWQEQKETLFANLILCQKVNSVDRKTVEQKDGKTERQKDICKDYLCFLQILIEAFN